MGSKGPYIKADTIDVTDVARSARQMLSAANAPSQPNNHSQRNLSLIGPCKWPSEFILMGSFCRSYRYFVRKCIDEPMRIQLQKVKSTNL